MKKLMFEDINLETHFSYAIYSCGYSSSTLKYQVYECDADGHMKCIKEYTSYDKARALVLEKCKVNNNDN